MIDHQRKFIFIHIPKTGGTSIESALLKFHGIHINLKLHSPLKHIRPTNKRRLMCGDNLQHARITDFPVEFQKKYFCFAVVRNPWDLFVSEFEHSQKSKRFKASFNQFVNRPRMSMHHGKNQVSFLNKNINFIGRFERLQEDFNKICHKINIPEQQLPYANKTKHKHYTEYYNDETREIIAEKYAKDIEYFGYRFGE